MVYRPVSDVHLILERPEGQVLLAERANTGYADGLVNVPPGGKLEDGEGRAFSHPAGTARGSARAGPGVAPIRSIKRWVSIRFP